MADNDPAGDDAQAAADKLVELAYGDLLQPSAREIGQELREFTRAVIIAGRGFGYLVRETYEPFVLEALKRVPFGRRVVPAPPIIGRVLEAVSYEPKGTPAYEMFQGLLCAAMDSERIHLVHPSFPLILSRLCTDEVRMLKALSVDDIYMEWGDWSPSPSEAIPVISTPSDLFEQPDAFDLYYHNLESLNLITRSPSNEDRYTQHLSFRTRWRIHLDGMGRHLMAACELPSSSATSDSP